MRTRSDPPRPHRVPAYWAAEAETREVCQEDTREAAGSGGSPRSDRRE